MSIRAVNSPSTITNTEPSIAILILVGVHRNRGIVCGSVILFGFILLRSILENGVKYLTSQSVNDKHIISNVQAFSKVFCDQQRIVMVTIGVLMTDEFIVCGKVRNMINNVITFSKHHNFYHPFL